MSILLFVVAIDDTVVDPTKFATYSVAFPELASTVFSFGVAALPFALPTQTWDYRGLVFKGFTNPEILVPGQIHWCILDNGRDKKHRDGLIALVTSRLKATRVVMNDPVQHPTELTHMVGFTLFGADMDLVNALSAEDLLRTPTPAIVELRDSTKSI